MNTQTRTWRPSVPNRILADAKPSCQGADANRHSTPARSPGAPPPRAASTPRAEHTAHLCAMAQFLAPADRALLLLAHSDGKTLAQIGALVGATRHATQRRLQRLARRVLAPEFAFVAARLRDLDAPSRAVARICILEGRSVRQGADELKMSRHAVRETRLVLLGMAKGAGQSASVRSAVKRRVRRASVRFAARIP